MKVTVIGSHLCPDTLYALQQLAQKLILRIFYPVMQILRHILHCVTPLICTRRSGEQNALESHAL